MRSTGRIPKEIPILLIGSDLDGKVFSEPTKTVVLSLHGAGILSRHKLSPEQELVLRWPERDKEAEIRIVGHIGTRDHLHTYGVAFFDPNLNFWEIDFPLVSPIEMELGRLSLVCMTCKTLEKIDDTSIEADVCATNDGVIRFCKRCGTSTFWKPSQSQALTCRNQESVPETAKQLPLFASSPAPSPKANSSPAPSPAPVPPPAPPASPPSFYASARELPQSLASSQTQTTAVLTLPSLDQPAVPRVNRRKHSRVKVNYTACVRHPQRGDDIVTCEDMSKGGLRFKSRQQYYPQSLIEVAVPYAPGQPAIFVPAQVVFVEELPEQKLFRCGVAFLKPTKPRDEF